MYGTYYRTAVSLTGLVNRRVEDSEQRIVLLVLSELSSLVCLSSQRVSAKVIYEVCEVFALSLRSLSLLSGIAGLLRF